MAPFASASPTPPARCCAATAHSDSSSSAGAAASTATSTGGLRGGKQTSLFLFTREVHVWEQDCLCRCQRRRQTQRQSNRSLAGCDRMSVQVCNCPSEADAPAEALTCRVSPVGTRTLSSVQHRRHLFSCLMQSGNTSSSTATICEWCFQMHSSNADRWCGYPRGACACTS